MIEPNESVEKLRDGTRLKAETFLAEFRGSEVVTCQIGEILLREGSKEENCFLIESGSLEITKKTSNGKVVPIGVIWPGDYLGEISMLAGRPRGATATARTKVTAIRFKYSDFIKLLGENDPFATRLSLELCRLLSIRCLHLIRVLSRGDKSTSGMKRPRKTSKSDDRAVPTFYARWAV